MAANSVGLTGYTHQSITLVEYGIIVFKNIKHFSKQTTDSNLSSNDLCLERSVYIE